MCKSASPEYQHELMLLRYKARQLRTACLITGIVGSPTPAADFNDLPEWRQARWIELAKTYCRIFGDC